VKTALEDWLPSQDEFDKFASRLSEKRSTQTLSASENSGGKSKPTRSVMNFKIIISLKERDGHKPKRVGIFLLYS